MALSIEKLTNFYIISTFALFAYTFNQVFKKADNYFSAALIYLDETITNFIFYNMIFSLGILFYKACIWLFFVEVKQNETIKIVDKLKAKIIDVILFCYIMDGQIEMNSFTCIVFIFFSYILHCMAIFRSEYLIHTPASLSLNLNYRLTALFLILIFFDYELLVYSIDLLYSQSATHFIFVYYTIIISLSIIEPIIKYFFDFYQKYTLCHIRNIDERLALISLWISVPILLIQIVLAIFLAMKFSIFFYLMFTVIELVSQLSHTIKSYNRIKKLTDTMKNLKKIDQQEIKKHHDNTCMVCFQDMTEATLLPCKHFFHDQCLRQWIIKNSNHFCPKCKKEFNFDNKKQQKKQQNQEVQRRKNQKEVQQKIREERLKRLQKLQEKLHKNKDKNKQKFTPKQKVNYIKHPQVKPDFKQLIKEDQNQIQSQYAIPSAKLHYSQKSQPRDNQYKNESLQIMNQNVPLQIIQRRQRKYMRIGSLAYGLPTQAVYRRTYRHMYVRDTYERVNDDLIKDLSLMDYQQMMLFADH